MRQFFSTTLVVLFVAVSVAFAHAEEFPKYKGFINDFAGIMDSATIKKLEDRVRNYEKATSYEIAVATIPDLGGRPISDYAIYLFKAWGVGKKGLDNGILLLIAPNEPKGATKAWIVNGRGVEDVVTDLKSGRIVTETMKPLWKEGKKNEAIVAGIEKIISVLGNTPFERRLEEKKREQARAAQEKQLREQRVATVFTITGAIVASSIAIGLIAWRLRKRSRRKEEERRDFEKLQWSTLSTRKSTVTAFAGLFRKYEDFKKAAKAHTQFFPESAMGAMVAEVEDVYTFFKKIEQELVTEEVVRSADPAALEIVRTELAMMRSNVNTACGKIDARLSRITATAKAAVDVPLLLKDINCRVEELEQKVSHKDVSSQTRAQLSQVIAGIAADKIGKEMLEGKKQNELSWVDVSIALSKTVELLQRLDGTAQNEIQSAQEAREKGPQLFKKVPELISRAEAAVAKNGKDVPEIKRRLAKVKDANHQATLLSQADSLNWTLIYPLLLIIQKETQGIFSEVEGYQEEIRQEARRKEEKQREDQRRRFTARNVSNSSSDDEQRRSSSISSPGWDTSSISISSNDTGSNFGGGDTTGAGGGGGLD